MDMLSLDEYRDDERPLCARESKISFIIGDTVYLQGAVRCVSEGVVAAGAVRFKRSEEERVTKRSRSLLVAKSNHRSTHDPVARAGKSAGIHAPNKKYHNHLLKIVKAQPITQRLKARRRELSLGGEIETVSDSLLH